MGEKVYLTAKKIVIVYRWFIIFKCMRVFLKPILSKPFIPHSSFATLNHHFRAKHSGMAARVFQLMNHQFPLPSDFEFDESSITDSDDLPAMDNFIHRTEVQAYASLLRAFMYNTNDLNKEKQNLIISLIKELKISNDDHNEVLAEIKNYEMVHLVSTIREGKSFDNFSSERGVKSPFPAVSTSQQDQPLSSMSLVKYV